MDGDGKLDRKKREKQRGRKNEERDKRITES